MESENKIYTFIYTQNEVLSNFMNFFDVSFDGKNYTDFVMFYETFRENHTILFDSFDFIFFDNIIEKNDDIQVVIKEIEIIYNHNNFLLQNINRLSNNDEENELHELDEDNYFH